MQGLTRVRNRETGAVTVEHVFRGDVLSTLYETRIGRFCSHHVLSRRWASSVYGWMQHRPASRQRIPEFVESLGIDLEEAELPLEKYRSMNDFFTRRLKPEKRPIDPDPSHLVSPADGRVLVYPSLKNQEFRIKDRRVLLEDLVGDGAVAREYVHGTAIVIRLAPADYHRFHFPDDGVASASISIRGRLHSVHPIALASGAPSFRNKRTMTHLESRGCGPLTLLEIGAMCVGTIVQTYRAGPVRRGQEKGFFQFGGSTIVLLAREGRLQVDDDLITATEEGFETQVRMGTRLALAVA